MDFQSLSPSPPATLECQNCFQAALKTPSFDVTNSSPGFNQLTTIPLLNAVFRSSFATINYTSEEKKVFMELSPIFGSLPIDIRVFPLHNFDIRCSCSAFVPLTTNPVLNFFPMIRFDSPTHTGKLQMTAELQSVVNLNLKSMFIIRDLYSPPVLAVSSTFGSLGTFWGMKLKWGFPPTLIGCKFLLNHKSPHFTAAAKYVPAGRQLSSEISVNAAGWSVGAAARRTADGLDAVAGARFEWATGSVEVKRSWAGKILATAEVIGGGGTTFTVWAGHDFAKNWLKPLFGARITVGSR
jgi:hypothetical protein